MNQLRDKTLRVRGELTEHRRSVAHKRMLEREDAKHDPWREVAR
jgi:hypothetical protein